MCVEWRTATIATPCCRARVIAHSRANMVECWPNPRWASTRAATALSRATTGRADGTMRPRSASPTYCGTRMTPWES